jgi:alpha-amylase
VARAEQAGYPAAIVEAAQEELHKAQCNCAYWHGSFAGVYLSHLRQAVYRHLIRADNILDRTADRPEHWVEAVVRDHNLDVRNEVCLASDRLIAFVAPHDGGTLYELDVRAAARNVLATVANRPEPYHTAEHGAPPADRRLRKGLIEHCYAERPTLETAGAGAAGDLSDFAAGSYHFRLERRPEETTLRLWRNGRIGDRVVKLTKRIVLVAGADALACEYEFENLPPELTFHFGVELNFTGFDDRAGAELAGDGLYNVRLVDRAAGLAIGCQASRPASWLSYPVRAVHRCEAGIETTHQALCVLPSWQVAGDAQGRWSVTLSLPIELLGVAPALHPDLGDVERPLTFPQAEIVTHTETVRGKPEVRRRASRRLKTAG